MKSLQIFYGIPGRAFEDSYMKFLKIKMEGFPEEMAAVTSGGVLE